MHHNKDKQSHMIPSSHTLTLSIIPSATSITLHTKLRMVPLAMARVLYYNLSTDHTVGIRSILGSLCGSVHLPNFQ